MKKIICIMFSLMVLIFPLSTFAFSSDDEIKQGDVGSNVMFVQNRLKDLGYLNFRATGKYSDLTVVGVSHFQAQNGLPTTGNVDKATMDKLFDANVKKNPLNPSVKKISGPAYNGTVKEKGALSTWENINSKFTAGSEVSLKDFNTGKTFNMKRIGGKNLAYVTTVTEDDYDIYRSIFKGDTWEHRPMLVTIGNVVYAASLFGMPTYTSAADESGMSGHTFLYFNASKTDVFSLNDEEDVIAINKAT